MCEFFDVAVIGAGVSGAAIARELSRYQGRFALLEACADVAMGASKANSAIVHAGYDCVPGTLMAKLNVRGNEMMEDLCREMNVHFKRCGSYVIAFSEEEKKSLEVLLERGKANGVPDLSIISGDELRKKEPAINPEVKYALYAPTGAITCPYELTLGLCDNAVMNGVQVLREFKVVSVVKEDGAFIVKSEKGAEIRCGRLINAAGVYADEINAMVGGEAFRIFPRKGEYMLLDRKVGGMLSSVIFQTPSAMGKGILVSPTVDGNIFAGPTAKDMDDKEDKSTTAEGIAELSAMSLRSVPNLPLRSVITGFAGIRAQVEGMHDFIIQEEKNVPGFINVAGICSPGLSSAPAIAEMVMGILKESGMKMEEKADFNPIRPKAKRFREMTMEERQAAIKENPLYGHIICRCETVTEAEIVAAIHAPVGARTLDGVKHRTRAGMGRCQAGFCSPRVMEILSRELKLSMEELTKNGEGSELLVGSLVEED